MSCKEWYEFVLQSEIAELGPDGAPRLVACRVELQLPQHDWSRSWGLARLNGLSSSSISFLWKLLHQLLPTRERQSRILRGDNSAVCQVCDSGEVDNILHAFAKCSRSKVVFDWMKTGLDKFAEDLTAEKILLLDIKLSTNLPFNELPLVWFIAEVLGSIWETRAAGKLC